MSFKSILSTILVFAFSVSAAAEIRETNFMADAFADATPGDVIVLDIDNTILEPAQTLGSDQWFGYLLSKFKKSGLDENAAIDKAIREWTQVQEVTSVRLVERTTPALIRDLQENKIMVIALTARPVDLKRATARQLHSAGINFQDRNVVYTNNKDIELFQGILFVGPKNNKGTVLQHYLQTRKIHPKRLIFVDDKEKHVKNMDAVFTPTGLTNINFRYSAADARVKAFNAALVDVQWEYFQKLGGVLITDEEAERIAVDRRQHLSEFMPLPIHPSHFRTAH